MKHLVTGGSGFLGHLIARRLLERGEQVRILDIWDDPERSADIEYMQCDIRDGQGVARAMQGIDVVHHNVALVPLTKSGHLFHEVNVDGSRIAAEEAVRAGVQSFIYMSSSAIFGLAEAPHIGSAEPRPAEIYGRAKLAGELEARRVLDTAGLPTIVIRPRTILGHGRLGIYQILFDWIRDNRNVYVVGSGNNRIQFVHADDLMDLYTLALDQEKPGVYNVGTDRFNTLRRELEGVVEYAGSRSRVKSLPQNLAIQTLRVLDWLRLSPLAPWHYLTYHLNISFDVKPLLDLGWQPRYSNQEMLRESYDWFVANFDRVKAEKAGSAHRRPVRELALRIVKRLS